MLITVLPSSELNGTNNVVRIYVVPRLHCFRPGIEFIWLTNQFIKSSLYLILIIFLLRPSDIFYSVKLRTVYRANLASSIAML